MRALISLTAALGGCLVIGASAGAVAAKPAQAPVPARQCFNTSQVHGFTADSEHAVYINVGVNRVYRAEVFGVCGDIDWSTRIGVRSRGGSFVCDARDLEFVVPNFGTGPRVCQVKSLRALTPDEVKALRSSKRKH
jgi:hypothetical protein